MALSRREYCPIHLITKAQVIELWSQNSSANSHSSIARAMSNYQLDFIGGDAVSQLHIDERKSKYVELAAFMNAEPEEIGKSSLDSQVFHSM